MSEYITDDEGIIIGFFQCEKCEIIYESTNEGFKQVPERKDGKIYTIYKEIICDNCK